jgi:hypothetical protein
MSLQIQKNDKKAYWLIGIFSVIVFHNLGINNNGSTIIFQSN